MEEQRIGRSSIVVLRSEADEDKFVAKAEAAFGADLYNPPSLNARLSKKTSAPNGDR